MKSCVLWVTGIATVALTTIVALSRQASLPPDYAAKTGDASEFTSASGLMFPAGTRFINYLRDDGFVGSERSYFMKAFIPTERIDEFMGQGTIDKADWSHPPSFVGDDSLFEEWSGGEIRGGRTMQIPLRRRDGLMDALIIKIVDKPPAGIDVYLDCENFSLVDRRPSAKR